MPAGQVEAPAGELFLQDRTPHKAGFLRRRVHGQPRVGRLPGAEAIAEEERAGKNNKHLRRTDKTQPLSIISDNFIRLLRTAASRLAGEAAKMIRQMSKETSAWDPKQPGCERKNPRRRRKYSINYKLAF
jgi:hypothetical protein